MCEKGTSRLENVEILLLKSNDSAKGRSLEATSLLTLEGALLCQLPYIILMIKEMLNRGYVSGFLSASPSQRGLEEFQSLLDVRSQLESRYEKTEEFRSKHSVKMERIKETEAIVRCCETRSAKIYTFLFER